MKGNEVDKVSVAQMKEFVFEFTDRKYYRKRRKD